MNYFFISYRNIKRRGLRSWLTLLGIVVGVVAVVSLITLSGGIKLAVNSQFGVSSTNVLTVQAGGLSLGPPGTNVVRPLTTEDAKKIGELDSVEVAIPRNLAMIKFQFNRKLEIKNAVSIVGEDTKKIYELLDLKVISGRLLKKGDTNKVLLGYDYSQKDNAFKKAIQSNNFVVIDGKKFEVAGILKKKGSFMVDGSVFIMDKELKSMANYGNNVNIIIVEPKDGVSLNKTKEDIENLLRKRRDVKKGEEDFSVSTPEAMLAVVNSLLDGIDIFIIIISSLSILVGVLGIVNTMTTSVLERKKDIGIMKAIGAKDSYIFFQFLTESGLIGLVGGFIGVVIGISIGFSGDFLISNFLGSPITPTLNYPLIIFTLLGSFLIGSIAGVIPAIKASRQTPVDSLRN